MSIEVRHISKTFGAFAALRDVSLHVRTGELVALLGPSGSGKTTLLRIIAGLETPDLPSGSGGNAGGDGAGGSVLFHDQDVSASGVGQRKVGFVFQHYALFRRMSVFENVAFGLKVRPRRLRPTRREIRDKVHGLLKLVQLDGLAPRYPSELSGGQRQRVALARALAVEPRVLLLDEPFGALDAKVRRELRRWLRKLHDEMHITSVFVTHDQEEALEVADRVAVMNRGRIEQIGTPNEVYDHPANRFVYNFLGNVNLFHGRLHDGQLHVGDVNLHAGGNGAADVAGNAGGNNGAPQAAADGAAASAAGTDGDPAGGSAAMIYVRPHDIDVARERAPADGPAGIPVRVDHISPVGPIVRLHLERLDTRQMIEAELTRERFAALAPKTGEALYARLRNPRVFSEGQEDYSI